jgi:hypothetical protein
LTFQKLNPGHPNFTQENISQHQEKVQRSSTLVAGGFRGCGEGGAMLDPNVMGHRSMAALPQMDGAGGAAEKVSKNAKKKEKKKETKKKNARVAAKEGAKKPGKSPSARTDPWNRRGVHRWCAWTHTSSSRAERKGTGMHAGSEWNGSLRG